MRKALPSRAIVTLFSYLILLACNKENQQPFSGSGSSGGNSSGGGFSSLKAYAGADTTIYEPFSGYYLNSVGTMDPTNVTAYTWRFLDGPSTVSIQNPDVIATNATGLIAQGLYSFELTVRYKNISSSARDTVHVTVGKPDCTSQLAEIVLSNLNWEFSWIMDINIEIARVLPPHSRMKSISIKRDNRSTWQTVVKLNTNFPDYTNHTWAYGTNTLVIYPPDSNMMNDTPDVKIQYCN